MSPIEANSSNALQKALCRQVMQLGEEVDPRSMRTRELLGVSFVLHGPRNRLTTIPERNWSGALAVAELAWHVRGDTSVDPLAFYTSRWRTFADPNGEVRGSCYGAQIFQKRNGKSQWENVKALLIEEVSSRRAILNFRGSEDVSLETNDLSCTNSLQFIARQGKLHAFVSMRSNDVIWGVPYDLFLFTSLQELMAVELGLELGAYHHYAASMHIYERHYKLASRIAESKCGVDDEGEMPPILGADAIHRLAGAELLLRVHGLRPHDLVTDFERLCFDLLNQHQKISSKAA